MRLSDVADGIGARVLTNHNMTRSIEIDRFFAANKMSDLLDEANDSTLLVSALSNPHLLHVAELLDVPCICLIDDAQPHDGLVQAASDSGKVLLVSRTGMDETCRLLGERGLSCVRKANA